jgi:proteasome assembly chaperone (PAC2) family protein
MNRLIRALSTFTADDGYIRGEAATAKKLWIHLERAEKVNLKDAAMVVAVSTSLPQYRALYSQGREVGSYLLRKMKFKLIATVHSSCFPAEVTVRSDGMSTLPACYLYINHGHRDVLLFCGDASPIDDQYQFARFLLHYAAELGVTEVFSIGARWTEGPLSPDVDPEPNGFATDRVGAARLKRYGVKLISEEAAPFFVSIVAALAADYGMRGYKLSVDHGEPSPHPRSVAQILKVLSRLAGFEVPLDELRAAASAQSPPTQSGDIAIYH